MTDQKPIVDLVKKFVAGFNRHDHEYLAQMYTETADFISVLGEHWVGVAELRDGFAGIHSAFLKNTTMKTDKVRIKILSPDVAIVHHSWTVLHGKDGSKSYRGIITHVVTLVASHWKIESSHNSTVA